MVMSLVKKQILLGFLFLFFAPVLLAQERETRPPEDPTERRIRALEERLNYMEQSLAKDIDDLMWFQRMGDIAIVDKIKYTGPPPRVIPNPTGQGAGNPVIINAYAFIPRKFENTRLPLLVYAHGGVHSDFSTSSSHVIRELVEQGDAVIAPDYRGSTGYGRGFWQLIDYGGLENEDVYTGMKWMLENHTNIDPHRVGILGWSHGGMITLMNIFEHPHDYQVAYAGAPVCDLIARLDYMGKGYAELFSAPYHLGKTLEQAPEEYRRRSPVTHAAKLQTPLLIHANTSDEDVRFMEIEHLIAAMQAAAKKFEHKVYTNAPGGHYFNRLDTTFARESRAEVYRFLARYLKPPKPAK